MKVLDRCVVCGGKDLRGVLNLGEQPLANAFHNGKKSQSRFPLYYWVCPSCWHGQLSVAVEPSILFTNYAYASGTTRTLKKYFEEFAEKLERDLNGKDHVLNVLEIGCNDGTLLREIAKRGHDVAGVDPAANLSTPDEVIRIDRFWDDVAATDAGNLGGDFDAIIAMNVLAHVADPVEFLTLAKRVLARTGRIYVQTSQALMLLYGEYDTIYHEHISYFTVSSMCRLASEVGLKIEKITHEKIHGTSMLVELSHGDGVAQRPEDFDVGREEIKMGYYAWPIYERFRLLAEQTKSDISKIIGDCKHKDYRIVGYGAAAKGMTFVNYCGLEMEAIVDDAPLKQGKLCPGSNIPVMKPEDWMSHPGKICWVLLAWNFGAEIMERIKTARPDAQDLFLTAFPNMVLT